MKPEESCSIDLTKLLVRPCPEVILLKRKEISWQQVNRLKNRISSKIKIFVGFPIIKGDFGFSAIDPVVKLLIY
jgi:hypothetical protein